jgi:hypothetical protein
MAYEKANQTARDVRGLPQLRRVVRVVTAAQIAALNGTPLTLVANAGGTYGVMPERAHFFRAAGTGWTANGATKLEIKTTLFPFVILHTFDLSLLTGTGPLGLICFGPSTTGTTISTAISTAVGSETRLEMPGGQATGGTGSLTVTFWYRLWPAQLP